MSYMQFLFSFEGRISRSDFWLKWMLPFYAVGFALFFIGSLVSMPTAADPGFATSAQMGPGQLVMTIVIFVYFLVALWPSLAVPAKRWHDRDKSGWWTLIAMVPVIGLWMLIECGFLKGTDGPNRFGADPLGGHRPAMEPQMHGLAGE